MKLEELHAKLSSLIEQCQTVMAACATMMEEEKGGPGSGRKPGSGKPKDKPDKKPKDDYDPAAEGEAAAYNDNKRERVIDNLPVNQATKDDIRKQIREVQENGSRKVDLDALRGDLTDQLGYSDLEHEEINSRVDLIIRTLEQ